MANESLIRTLSTNFYEIEERILEIAKDYFTDPNTGEEKINYLKSGFFGWLIESLAELQMDDLLMKNIIYNETFLNSMSLSTSIYNKAMSEGIENFAEPAFGEALIGLHLKDLNNIINANNRSNTIITINKESFFSVQNKYNFILPYEVNINLQSLDNPIVFYNIKRQNIIPNNLKIDSFYLSSFIAPDQTGEKYLMIRTPLIQAERIFKSIYYTETDYANDEEFIINFNNQLAGFNVYYSEDGINYEKLKTFFFDSYLNFTNSYLKYCVYEITDENKLVIKFPHTTGGFRPRNNSYIDIEVFTTLGKVGNISYSGLLTPNFSINSPFQIKSNIFFVNQKGSTNFGKNRYTLDQLKGLILSKITNPTGLLISENDITNYFKSVFPENDVIIKKSRIDSVDKKFNIYFSMKDTNGLDIPGNTVSLKIRKDEVTDGKVIEEGSFICIEKNNPNNIFYLKRNEEQNFFENKNLSNYFFYKNFYSIIINTEPFLYLDFIRTNVSKEYSLKYSDVLQNNFNKNKIILNKIKIERDTNSSIDNPYNINFSFVFEKNNIEYIETKLKVYLLFYTLNDDLTKNYLFKTDVKINTNLIQNFSLNSCIIPCSVNIYAANTYNSGYLELSKNDKSGNPILTPVPTIYDEKPASFNDTFNIGIDEEIYADILIARELLDTNNVYVFKGDTDMDLDNIETALYEEIIPSNFSTVLKMTTIEPILFFNNVTNILGGNIISNEKEYIIENIPVLEASFYDNKDEKENFLNKLEKYEDFFDELYKRVQNEFKVNINFINTFGPSKVISTGTVKNSISINIKLKNGVESSMIEDKIREFLVNYWDNLNNTLEEIIYFSNITTALETKFENYIKSAEVVSINGNREIRKIETINKIKLLDIEDYVPEKIGIYYNYQSSSDSFYKNFNIYLYFEDDYIDDTDVYSRIFPSPIPKYRQNFSD